MGRGRAEVRHACGRPHRRRAIWRDQECRTFGGKHPGEGLDEAARFNQGSQQDDIVIEGSLKNCRRQITNTNRKIKGEIQMAITSDRVREIFKGLENGDGAAFFEHVSDNVDWIVEGTHPLAAHYLSKRAILEGTFSNLAQVLPLGAQLHVENLIVKDDQAVVELHSLATAKNGMRFDNRYCWVVYFQDGLIMRVRAYLDSAMVTQLFADNPLE